MKKRIVALLLVLAVILAVPAMAIPEKPADQLYELEEIAYYIRNLALKSNGTRPVVDVTQAQLAADPALFRKTVDSWLAAYGDRFSYFMTWEEYEAGFPASDSYIGIGVRSYQTPTGLYVAEIIPGSPAEGSGLSPGCQIVSVGGADVSDMPYERITPLIRGTEGSKVDIGYIEPGSTIIRYETFTRRYILVRNVTYAIEGKVGTIYISQFGDSYDAEDFDNIYNNIFPQAGVESVIIDVRGNPGGAVNTLYAMLDCMTREKDRLFFRLRYSGSQSNEFLSTGNPGAFKPKKLVVLADEHSASCSEVFTGALQELGMAEVVGVPTYGKARSQLHIGLTSGDVLIITVSTVELQNIGEYQDVGIIPKHRVEQKTEPYPMPAMAGLDASRALFAFASQGDRWLAVEQRLAELGYFYARPDNVCDAYTIWCLNRFQASRGLPITHYASAAALKALQSAVSELALTEGVYSDAQMEYALGLLK